MLKRTVAGQGYVLRLGLLIATVVFWSSPGWADMVTPSPDVTTRIMFGQRPLHRVLKSDS